MEILTERLLLRELTEADAPACNAYERDPEVVRYTSHGERTLDESLARLRQNVAAAVAVPRVIYDFALVVREEGRLVGRVGFQVGRPSEHQAEIWWVLDRSRWGRGYAAEGARALLGLAFGELGLHRVIADLDPRNLASERVAEKLGMRREAELVENIWTKGEWAGTLIYAMLEREWAARESARGGARDGG